MRAVYYKWMQHTEKRKKHKSGRDKNQHRYTASLIAIVLAFTVLLMALFDLQVLKGEAYADEAGTTRTRTLTIPGARGTIFDVNGNPLALDNKIYNVEFYRDYITIAQREVYTNSIIRAIEIIEKYGKKIETSFAITKNENGEFVFYWGNVSEETAQKRENRWCQDFYFDPKKPKTPEEMYRVLRQQYKIPESMSDERAFQVLGVWQESIQNYYYSKSIVIAKNVSEELVAELESYSYEIQGFSIAETSSRIYPQAETAAHIIGYMGRISASTNPMYVQDYGYNTDDYIGVYGIENVMELYLTGNGTARSGKRVVETSNSGRILRELSYEAPKQGDDVYLTVDINMQKIAEEALRENIETIYQVQMELYNSKPEKYKKYENEMGRKIKMASIGAAVVMDVNTGKVLAMASYPSYDPNLFAQGMTQEQFEALTSDSRSPLINKAISASGMPGSTFKLVVGTAGLMEGKLKVEEEIADLGEWKKYIDAGTGPSCWRWTASRRTHGSINIMEAIMHSCNYFFFEVADRVGIEAIQKWAGIYGLTSKTNIELSNEIAGQVGSQEVLYDVNKSIYDQKTNMPRIVYNSIKKTINACAALTQITIQDDVMDNAINKILQMVTLSRTERLRGIRAILVEEMGLSRAAVDSEVKFHINDYLSELIWTPLSTVRTGIGSAITLVTPIAAARYVASIVNGGVVYDAHVVEKVVDSSGKTVMQTQPTVRNLLGVKEEYLSALKEGMKDVVSGQESSTAKKYFSNFKYKNEMGGKTGTAQVNDIDIENNSWFIAFAPYEKPEIAIVVFIPNGYAGAESSITVKAIVEYYLDLKYHVKEDPMPFPDTIVS